MNKEETDPKAAFAPFELVVCDGEDPDPDLDAVPVEAPEGTGRVEVTTEDVAEGVNDAVPTSTV